MNTGANLVIEKGAVVLDAKGNEIPAPLTADNIDHKDKVGESDPDWMGGGVVATWTDNR